MNSEQTAPTNHTLAVVAVQRLVGTLPNWFEHWNPAMRGAYKKGAEAAHNGKSIISCPYEDHRKPNGKLSWSRAFIRAWEQGHTDASVFINANPTADRRATAQEKTHE